MRRWYLIFMLILPAILVAQHPITIDGNFSDWTGIAVSKIDSANDEHDTDWFGDGFAEPFPRKYSDIDILEVKFAHDRENLYGYCKARGVIGRTSRAVDGHKSGRFYFIITIDVDNNDVTGYPLQEGNYFPNSTGYDMNMEVEFYDGEVNTGHYINHEFLTEEELEQGRVDLENHIIRMKPGTYEHYLQYVVFPDTSYVYVSDRGDPVPGGIIEGAVSEDGHEAEMKAPMWGFFWDENGNPIVALGDTIDISFSLEGSGELSESAVEMGYTGDKSVWGSDTAEPIEAYYLADLWTNVSEPKATPVSNDLFHPNYPNPFNGETTLCYSLQQKQKVQLAIHNMLGQEVSRLIDTVQPAGTHRLSWNPNEIEHLSSGIYFAILNGEKFRLIQQLLYLK
ncbi:T9SS type A sorting domain-containing protein [candidate division KSB1 bacterium]|nr:T9SS type A sorting domain-containing protein [candidate division KSB1 bacterium]